MVQVLKAFNRLLTQMAKNRRWTWKERSQRKTLIARCPAMTTDWRDVM
jgi:hypothetical protein